VPLSVNDQAITYYDGNIEHITKNRITKNLRYARCGGE